MPLEDADTPDDPPSDDEERETAEPSSRDRFLKRRRFLQAAGAVTGAGILAGCQQGQQETPSPRVETRTVVKERTVVKTKVVERTPEETPTPSPEEALSRRYPGLRILSGSPENAEAAARETYTNWVTPREEFYVRNHYPTPEIDAEEWTISLTGAVDQDVDLTLADLKSDFTTERVFHAMQCSGNGRSYFDPAVGGNQWTFGAVGNAEWAGAPLSEVLEEYGADTAEDMWLTVMGGEAPEGEDIFTRSIPMNKVMEDCLLAYEMNGSPLPADHGYPVRLLVPGWFGNNHVKWVQEMRVMDMMVFPNETWEPEGGRKYTHWQQYSYRIYPNGVDNPDFYERIGEFDLEGQMDSEEITHPYVYDQPVKSLIGHPGEGATVSPRSNGQIEVVGVAWAGDDAVDTIEVSTDGGDSWEEGELMNPKLGPYSWQLWRYMWDASPGEYTLASRATDDQGRSQPATVSGPDDEASLNSAIMNDQFPWNVKGYANNAYMPHAVDVTVEQ